MDPKGAKIGEIFNYGILHLEWPTALFIFAIFVLTMIVLNSLLFKPILRTLEARQFQFNKTDKKTTNLLLQQDKSEEDYRQKLSFIQDQIQKAREEALDQAMGKANAILDNTKKKIRQNIEMAEKELAEAHKSALQEAESLTEDLAQLIKNKVIA